MRPCLRVPLVMRVGLMSAAAIAPALAKEPGKTYCFNAVCHRILTIEETERAVGGTQIGQASFYGDPAHDRANPSAQTSSGEAFAAHRDDNVASPIYPDGTKLLVWNPATGGAALVRVNNLGPYKPGRLLDVSHRLAERLGFAAKGTALLHIKVVAAPTKAEARYLPGRSYPSMPGFIGTFASLDSIRTVRLERRVAAAPVTSPWVTTVVAVPAPGRRTPVEMASEAEPGALATAKRMAVDRIAAPVAAAVMRPALSASQPALNGASN